MGYWYLVEVIGFVGIPLYLYVEGVRRRDIPVIRIAAILTAVGIILNRLNISIIAYKWDAPVHYYPSWIEIEITLAIIFAEIWAFRWVVNRMPVLRKSPEWVVEEH
jgi:Ni/Fe-hydrogenase subunit HybB-like protein